MSRFHFVVIIVYPCFSLRTVCGEDRQHASCFVRKIIPDDSWISKRVLRISTVFQKCYRRMYVHRSDDLCFRLPEDAVSYALLQLKVRSLLLTEENLPLIAKKKGHKDVFAC